MRSVNCCGQGGWQHPDKALLLGRLRVELAGSNAELPERCQLWGAADGKAWRVVDWRGHELGVYGRHSIAATAHADELGVVVVGGALEVRPRAVQGDEVAGG
jgi:hypothetical protein